MRLEMASAMCGTAKFDQDKWSDGRFSFLRATLPADQFATTLLIL
jgi:hypothetical protein